jgi:integrase
VLTPESRAKLRAIGLHFHDLRREAGSRWQDAGVPLQTIRDWLGHSNISQTSTYLASTRQGSQDAMRQYERARALLEIASSPGSSGIQQPQSAETENGQPPNTGTILH